MSFVLLELFSIIFEKSIYISLIWFRVKIFVYLIVNYMRNHYLFLYIFDLHRNISDYMWICVCSSIVYEILNQMSCCLWFVVVTRDENQISWCLWWLYLPTSYQLSYVNGNYRNPFDWNLATKRMLCVSFWTNISFLLFLRFLCICQEMHLIIHYRCDLGNRWDE